MTSNVGSKLVLRGGRMGFSEPDSKRSFEKIQQEILSELGHAFSPEFINRLDEVIVFNSLGTKELRAIVDIQLEHVNMTLQERGLDLIVDTEAREWLLAKAGAESSTGARPLRRTIQRHLQDAVSEILIERYGEQIETIDVSVDGEKLILCPRTREPIAG